MPNKTEARPNVNKQRNNTDGQTAGKIQLTHLHGGLAFQVISPDLQKRKIAQARAKALKHHAMTAVATLAETAGHQLLNLDMTLNMEVKSPASRFSRFSLVLV